MAMPIPEILAPERICCRVHASSKKTALEELAKLIAGPAPSLSYTEIFDSFNARERLGSTGLGNGIAIPHGRLHHIRRPTAAFLQLDSCIDYDALDQKPVDLLFGLLVPAESADDHLRILACIATLFSDKTLVHRLRLETSPEKIYAAFAPWLSCQTSPGN